MTCHSDGYRKIDGLNWSSLKLMAESPMLYHWRVAHPRPDTPTLAFGRAVHCAILEPERYAECYVAEPSWQHDGRTKAGRAERAEWREQAAGREVLTADQAATIELVRQRIGEHQAANQLLDGGKTEQMITWGDDATGVLCKGRLDVCGQDYIVDLKTTSKPIARFEREAATYLYHGQIAWYLDGAIAAGRLPEDAAAYLVAVETVEPYDVGVFRVCGHALELGRRLYRRLLEMWLECTEADLWPGRYPAVVDLDIPSWAES